MDRSQRHHLLRKSGKLYAAITVLLCGTLSGCIGATPLPKRTRTPEGTEVKSVDLSFIHPGQTTRVEVMEKLKLVDTGYQGDRFFLGRWSSSNWGAWAFLVGMGNAVGKAERSWKSGNLLVEFDDAGIVKRYEAFTDGHALQQLVPVAADCPLRLATPLQLEVKYWRNARPVSAKIVLSESTFEFEELGAVKKPHKFALPAQAVLSVRTPAMLRDPDPTYTTQTVHFARDLKKIGGPRGKKLNLEVTLPQLVTLMSYVSHGAKAAPGEAGGKSQ